MALAAFVVFIYARACRYWFLSWDDNGFVYHNPVIVGWDWRHLRAMWSTNVTGNYAPLPLLSYALDFQWWGMRATGYHATNILWHVLAASLLYGWLRAVGIGRLGVWCGSAFFALHPVQVETVVWITQRRNLMATAGVLATLWTYHYSTRPSQSISRRRCWWMLSVLAGCGAVLCKASAMIVPLLCVTHDRWLRRLSWRESVRRSIPFWVIGLLGGLLAIWAIRVDGLRFVWHGGSVGATLWTLPRVWLAYLRLVVWPSHLSLWYVIDESHAWMDWRVWGALAVFGGVGWILWQWHRRQPRVAWWALWWVVALLPTANLVPLAPWMQDRHLYLPMIGCCGLVAEALTAFETRHRQTAWRWLLWSASAIVLVALTLRTVQRVAMWRDELTLWSDAVAQAPTAAIPRVKLGDALLAAGHQAEAREMYWSIADVAPSAAIGWTLRGQLLLREQRLEETRAAYARMRARTPASDQTQLAVGDAAYERGEWGTAVASYADVLTRNVNTHAMERLGDMAQRLGQPGAAAVWYRRIVRVQPWNVPWRRALAMALQASGDATQARRQLALAEAWQRDYQRLATAHEQASAHYARAGAAAFAALAAHEAADLHGSDGSVEERTR